MTWWDEGSEYRSPETGTAYDIGRPATGRETAAYLAVIGVCCLIVFGALGYALWRWANGGATW